ncbi:MAG: tetratricopeptide repeat protein [Bacteroidales bacterium]|nr:tetratricopeptide repeat protein [Bacteroidales bacterium]
MLFLKQAILTLLLYCLVFLPLGAKDKNCLPKYSIQLLEEAEAHVQNASYEKALYLYDMLLKSNPTCPEIPLKLAEVNYMTNNPAQVVKWYQKAMELNGQLAPVEVYRFALCMVTLGHYDKAARYLEKYRQVNPEDPRAEQFLASINNLHEHYEDSLYFAIRPMTFNTMASDISPVLHNNSLYFLSTRNSNQHTFKERYYDIFVVDNISDTNEIKPKKYKIGHSEKHQEGQMIFDKAHNKVIITRSDKTQGKEKLVSLSLYEACLHGDSTYGELSRVHFPLTNSAQPAISANGTALVFVSDDASGYGGADLYRSQWANGQWQMPQNMGAGLNTPGNEMFPFLLNDSILFFASNGHGGLGGLDIFRVNLNQQPYKPKNLGYPINSNHDDFGILLDSTGYAGYFSSNRPGGKGSDDIYAFKVIDLEIKGSVAAMQQDTAGAGKAKIIVSKEHGRADTVFTDTLGRFNIRLNPFEDVKMVIEKENFKNVEHTYTAKQLRQVESLDIAMKEKETVPVPVRAKKAKKGFLNISIDIFSDKGTEDTLARHNVKQDSYKLTIPVAGAPGVKIDVVEQ